MEHQSGFISTQVAGVAEDYLFGLDSLGLGLGLWTRICLRLVKKNKNLVDSSHVHLERFSTSMPSTIFLAVF